MLLERSTGRVTHTTVAELPELIPADSVMVVNDSRVRKARLYGRVGDDETVREFLLIEAIDEDRSSWTAMVQRPRQVARKGKVVFPGNRLAHVVSHEGEYVTLAFDEPVTEEYFDDVGHVPLPPYIRREDAPEDENRYQTVYARIPGSVAAPTAGLHLTSALLDKLAARGAQIERVELRVGPGTFLPVRTRDIEDHEIHAEWCELGRETASRIATAQRQGRRIIAVGTTSVRTLESAYDETSGLVRTFSGHTRLFIRPGYSFGVVNGLFTNFHTPESTLLMLVCAFAGTEHVLSAYRTAVNERYRFFSYGDAMLIL